MGVVRQVELWAWSGCYVYTVCTYIGVAPDAFMPLPPASPTRRLYDMYSGEMVWSYDDHEGSPTRLWRMAGRAPAVGLWTEDGLWYIRVSGGRVHGCDGPQWS